MRQARILRVGLALAGGLGLAASSGCCHHPNYYPGYYACPPGNARIVGEPSGIQYGAVCDVPPQVASQADGTVGSSSGRPYLADSPRPRVIVSRPGSSRNSEWRRADADGIATTRIEGGIDDSVRR